MIFYIRVPSMMTDVQCVVKDAQLFGHLSPSHSVLAIPPSVC